MIYNLVIYNFNYDIPEVELFQVEEGYDLRGLNVVHCDPSPAASARQGSKWHIDLCHRIQSRTAGSAGLVGEKFSLVKQDFHNDLDAGQ